MTQRTFDPDNGQIRNASDKCAPLVATVIDPWEHVEPTQKTVKQRTDFINLGLAMALAPDLLAELQGGIEAVHALLGNWDQGDLARSVNDLERWAGTARSTIEKARCKPS